MNISDFSYEKRALSYTVFFVLLALLLYIGAFFNREPIIEKLGQDRLLALALMDEAGIDPLPALKVENPDRLIVRLKHAAEPSAKALAALKLGLYSRHTEKSVRPAIKKYLLDVTADSLLRAACAHSLVFLSHSDESRTEASSILYEVYSRTGQAILRRNLLFALHNLGENGRLSLMNIIVDERRKGQRFFNFEFDEVVPGLLRAFVGKFRRRVLLEHLCRKRSQYKLMPFLVVIGALGSIYPLCLLFLLPFCCYTLQPVMVAWMILFFITLANVVKRSSIKLALSLGIVIVVLTCVENSPSFANHAIFAIFILWNIDAHLPASRRLRQAEQALVFGGRIRPSATLQKYGAVDAGAVEQLIGQLAGGPGERKAAFAVLDDPWPELLDQLIVREAEASDEERPYLLEAIGRFKNDKAYKLLKERLTSTVATVRAGAVAGLRDFRNTELLHVLGFLIKDPDKSVRLNAIDVLEEFPSRDSRPLLEPLLGDPDEKIQMKVRLILARLGE